MRTDLWERPSDLLPLTPDSLKLTSTGLEEVSPIPLLHREVSLDLQMGHADSAEDGPHRRELSHLELSVALRPHPLLLTLQEEAQLLISLWRPTINPFTWSREGTWVRYLDMTFSRQIQKVGGLSTHLEGRSLGKSLDPLNSPWTETLD